MSELENADAVKQFWNRRKDLLPIKTRIRLKGWKYENNMIQYDTLHISEGHLGTVRKNGLNADGYLTVVWDGDRLGYLIPPNAVEVVKVPSSRRRGLSAADMLAEGSQRVPRGLARLTDEVREAEEAHYARGD